MLARGVEPRAVVGDEGRVEVRRIAGREGRPAAFRAAEERDAPLPDRERLRPGLGSAHAVERDAGAPFAREGVPLIRARPDAAERVHREDRPCPGVARDGVEVSRAPDRRSRPGLTGVGRAQDGAAVADDEHHVDVGRDGRAAERHARQRRNGGPVGAAVERDREGAAVPATTPWVDQPKLISAGDRSPGSTPEAPRSARRRRCARCSQPAPRPSRACCRRRRRRRARRRRDRAGSPRLVVERLPEHSLPIRRPWTSIAPGVGVGSGVGVGVGVVGFGVGVPPSEVAPASSLGDAPASSGVEAGGEPASSETWTAGGGGGSSSRQPVAIAIAKSGATAKPPREPSGARRVAKCPRKACVRIPYRLRSRPPPVPLPGGTRPFPAPSGTPELE